MQRYNRLFALCISLIFSCIIYSTNDYSTSPKKLPPVLVVGGIMCDFFLQLEQSNQTDLQNPGFIFFKEGEKIPLKSFECYSGGGGLNVAIALRKLGHETFLASRVGKDVTGSSLLKELAEYGVNTSLVTVDETASSGTSFILPSSHGNNTILMNRGANICINKEHEFENLSLKGFSGVYLAPLSGNSLRFGLDIAKKAQKSNIPVLLNPSTTQIKDIAYMEEILKFVSIVLLNEIEATLLGLTLGTTIKNIQEQKNLALWVIEQGAKICIITNGSAGCLYATKESCLFQPPHPITPQKSVGAGDTFGATVFGSLLTQHPLEGAIERATIHSSSVLIEPIPHCGLLSHTILTEKLTNTLLDHAYSIA